MRFDKFIPFAGIVLLSACTQPQTTFQRLSSSQTQIEFRNDLKPRKAFGILYYLYYYNGGGVAVGDINHDGLPDIYFTANSKGGNKLYLNKGNFQFEDITQKAGVAGSADWCTGATMADVNGDGLLDIYVCAVQGEHDLHGRNELFINNGDGTFTESAEKYGLALAAWSTQAVFFDYDHDGDLDCFVLNQSHHPYQNIVDTANRRKFDPNAGGRLYRNDIATTGKFTDVSAQAGIYQSSLCYGLGISIADLNNDGWDDIYIGNDFHENDYYYINNGNGSFTESGAKHFGHYSRFSMGNDIADYNNDGQPDIVTVDMLPPDEKTLKTYGSDEHADIYNLKIIRNGYQNQVSRNCLQQNNGSGKTFSDIALMAGVSATDWSWSPLFADFDNDGNKDLFISSGIVKRPVDLDYVRFVSDLSAKVNRNASADYDEMTVEKMPEGSSYCYLYKGDGKGDFQDVGKDWGVSDKKGFYNGAAYADLDNDGNLDLIVNSLNANAFIYKNNAKKKNFLTIDCKGDGLNTFGIGTKAWVFANGKMQYEQLMLTRGFQSSVEPRLHFGLDTCTRIDSVLIVWPNQRYQVIKNVPVNKPLTVLQRNAADSFRYNAFFAPKELPLTADEIKCDWKHVENDFNDFSYQRLIPHKESTRGPKMAVADVNHDGLDDFFVCGAKGQASALMIQQPDGSFARTDTSLFNHYALCEDVDAAFFDANGDGYVDLWVVGGGNEMPANGFANTDRLYLNDGKGHFKLSPTLLPQHLWTKSCITVADVDHDGDMDVFVGLLADQQKFGLPMQSYLYLNDGKGNFTYADLKTIDLTQLGIVTAATFTDLNKDGWLDLVVTGEWMGVKIFMNDHGRFTAGEIPNSTGIWQSVYATDVNGDGYPDLLAGNWGQNSKLWAGKNGPVKLYVKDFDFNGRIEQVLCYTIDGKEYPFLPKDELEQAIPVLKKAYLTYGEVAGKTVQYMFYDLFKNPVELKAETLSSSCFLNDGKGGFRRIDLPKELQMAPIFSFAPMDAGDPGTFIAGGNFYGTIPYEGRYDALMPTLFGFDRTKKEFYPGPVLPDARGEIRDWKWLHSARNGQTLVAARNNDSLLFFHLAYPKK
ncbi:VCBS repeat-containing protein [Puia sp.]|uniref:VCBS repeat-containing protein n=1 Tax=Puia sp. TaxID=2045100 RepID=UPI002F40A56A